MPEEILIKILLLLNPIDAINFGVSNCRLHSFLTDPPTFLKILHTAKFDVEERVWYWGEEPRKEKNQQLIEATFNRNIKITYEFP